MCSVKKIREYSEKNKRCSDAILLSPSSLSLLYVCGVKFLPRSNSFYYEHLSFETTSVQNYPSFGFVSETQSASRSVLRVGNKEKEYLEWWEPMKKFKQHPNWNDDVSFVPLRYKIHFLNSHSLEAPTCDGGGN